MGSVCSKRGGDLPVEVREQLGAFVQPTRAKLRWIQATQYILRIIRLRRRQGSTGDSWGLFGAYLLQPRIRDLTDGIGSNRKGHLIRYRAARPV